MEHEQSADVETEIALLRRTGEGDRQSFEQLYERFARVLFSTAFRVLSNHQAAEDVLQDVFLQIWEKAPLYDPTRGKPLTWAVTLTRNKAIDRLRSVQRRSRLHDDAERESQVFEQFDETNSFDLVESVEKGRMVREAMTHLPKEQREAIDLAFFSGLTQIEIAERLQEPLGTIKARIRRGMMKLRDSLENQL